MNKSHEEGRYGRDATKKTQSCHDVTIEILIFNSFGQE